MSILMSIRRVRTLWRLRRNLSEMVHQFLPGDEGAWLRHRYYAKKLRSLGEGARIDVGVQFVHPEWISIGANTWIDKFVIMIGGPPGGEGRRIHRLNNPNFLGQRGEIRIGAGCHIAPYCLVSGIGGVWVGDYAGLAAGVKIYSFSHTYNDPARPDDPTIFRYTPMAPMAEQSLIEGPVVLGENCGLASEVIVTPGVTIGEGAWIGATSVVTKDIPPFKVAVGAPPRVVRDRRAPRPPEPTDG
jgi:acetyltransferase-like isoleucine patch superfamily enzyme